MTQAAPFLKWVGGKKNFVSTLGPAINTYLNKTKGHYVEPFVGGGAMLFALGRPKSVINDVLPDLAKTYEAVKNHPLEVALLLCELRDFGSDEKSYYAVRASEPGTDVEAAARMIYLNAHCFNGVWRTNKKGKNNVPYGHAEGKITDSLIERIALASEVLQKAEIFNGDFEPIVKAAEAGDLLYVDPPYDGTYTGYSKDDFVGMSQARLGSELAEANRRGVAFIAHNSSTEAVRSWYSYATIVPAGEARSVNSDGNKRGKTQCLLITNRPELLVGHLSA
jgi:DNA adenine methylase